jgi:hypothetical protein
LFDAEGAVRHATSQTIGFVESLLRLAGFDWKVPDFSTLCHRQKTFKVPSHTVVELARCIC